METKICKKWKCKYYYVKYFKALVQLFLLVVYFFNVGAPIML